MTAEAQELGRQPTSQRGHWAVWDSEARKRAVKAVDVLAARLGRPAFDATIRQSRDPLASPKSIGDLELFATLAESVADLTEEVDGLRVELAGLKGANGE